MVDVNISSIDNLSGQPQDDDVVPIIRDSTTVLSQSWDDIKDALIPDITARSKLPPRHRQSLTVQLRHCGY